MDASTVTVQVTVVAPKEKLVGASLVVLAPLLRAPKDDTYPLSTYPMFATDRGAVHEIATAVGIDTDGSVMRLSPRSIAGTDEVVLASVTVARAVARGEADELCAELVEFLAAGFEAPARAAAVS